MHPAILLAKLASELKKEMLYLFNFRISSKHIQATENENAAWNIAYNQDCKPVQRCSC